MAILAALIWGLGIGLLAHLFGFHPAIGCYMAGLVLDEEYFAMCPDYHAVHAEVGIFFAMCCPDYHAVHVEVGIFLQYVQKIIMRCMRR